jgi:hypothetical protein
MAIVHTVYFSEGGLNSLVPLSNDVVTLVTHAVASLAILVFVFLPRIVLKVRSLQVQLLPLPRSQIF